jgi:hypothetical protein
VRLAVAAATSNERVITRKPRIIPIVIPTGTAAARLLSKKHFNRTLLPIGHRNGTSGLTKLSRGGALTLSLACIEAGAHFRESPHRAHGFGGAGQ